MEPNDTIDLREILKVFSTHRLLIMSIFLGAVITSLVISLLLTPIYQASTTILVKGESPLANPLLDLMEGGKPAVQDYVDLLRSRSLLFAAARKLNLVEDENAPELEALQKTVNIQAKAQSNLIEIQVESPDPETAKNLANELVNELIARNRSDNSQEARNAREFIAQQLEEISAQLNQAESSLQAYKETHKVFEPSEEAKARIDRIAKLEEMRYETRVALQETETRIKKINEAAAGDPQKELQEAIAANPAVQTLKAKLAEVEAELAGAREKYTDRHPLVLSLLAQEETLKKQLAAEIGLGVSEKITGLEIERWALQAREDTLSNLLAEAEKEFLQLPEEERELTVLTRNAKVLEQIYLMLRQKYEEAKITEAIQTSDIRVVDKAVTPTEPVRPRKMLNVLIAAFLGLFVGVAAAFTVEYLDTTIRSSKEVEELLGLPILGKIPSYAPGRVSSRSRK